MSVTLPRPAASQRLGTAGLLVLLSVTFLTTLDFFVVNVALPTMQSTLAAGDGLVTAWVAGYGAAFAGFLVLGARLGDRLGRRRTFVLGVAAFTVASAACGAAPSGVVLLACRVAQGLAAALAAPQVLSTIGATLDGEARGRAIGVYGLVAGGAAIAGQLVGGALIELDLLGLGWRWCFLVNVPVGAVAVLLAGRVVPETVAERTPSPDAVSVGLLSTGLCGLVVLLAVGSDLDWSLSCVVGIVVAADLLVAFALRQVWLARRERAPLVDLRLLRSPALGVGSLVVVALNVGIASSFLVLALALQGGLGLGPLDAGLVFTILALGYVATSAVASGLLERRGPVVLVGGAALSVVGQVLLAVAAPAGAIAPLVPGLLVAGVGMGLQFGPSMTVALSRVPVEASGQAAGIVTTLQQLGGAVGVAVLGVVFGAAVRAGGIAHAFAVASWCLAGVSGLVLLLALVLRRRYGRDDVA